MNIAPVLRRTVIVLALCGGAAGASVRAQLPLDQAQETFRSAVDVVTIQASVRDARGRSLQGLTTSDFEVRDVFVPEQHTHVLMAPRPTQDGILYRLPAVSVFAWTVSVVPLGIARGVNHRRNDGAICGTGFAPHRGRGGSPLEKGKP